MILLSRLIMLTLIVVLLVFCMSNLDPVTVRMLTWESPPMPLFLVLLFLFFFGFFLALVWQAVQGLSRRRQMKHAPVAVQSSMPAPLKKKGGRRWGLGKGKTDEAAAPVKPAPWEGANDGETVDKGDEKDNITGEPDEPPVAEK